VSKAQVGKSATDKTQKGSVTPKKSKATSFIAIIIIFLVLVSSGVVVFMLNVGNIRGTVLSVFLPQIETEEQLSEQQQLEAQIRDEIIRLDAIEEELNTRENQLNIRENELNLKAEDLDKLMQENADINSRLTLQLESLTRITEMYGSMESEQAAQILSEMESIDQIVLILKNLNNKKSGEILGLMEPQKAAGLIERMMPQQ
jgi:flagellar motility protein MotE (MotC chaperone)